MTSPETIAIDGPAASGKSTLARLLAEELGYLYFDTGVMYRAVTWIALQRNLVIEDEAFMMVGSKARISPGRSAAPKWMPMSRPSRLMREYAGRFLPSSAALDN